MIMGGRVKPIDIFPHFLVVQGDVACNQEPRPTKLPDCKGMQGLINSVYLLAHGHDEGDVQTSFVRVKEDETAVVTEIRLLALGLLAYLSELVAPNRGRLGTWTSKGQNVQQVVACHLDIYQPLFFWALDARPLQSPAPGQPHTSTPPAPTSPAVLRAA